MWIVDNSADNVFVHAADRGERRGSVRPVRGLAHPSMRLCLSRRWVGDRLSTATHMRIWPSGARFRCYPHIPIPYHEHDRFLTSLCVELYRGLCPRTLRGSPLGDPRRHDRMQHVGRPKRFAAHLESSILQRGLGLSEPYKPSALQPRQHADNAPRGARELI